MSSAKMDEPIEMPYGDVDSGVSKELVGAGSPRRNLPVHCDLQEISGMSQNWSVHDSSDAVSTATCSYTNHHNQQTNNTMENLPSLLNENHWSTASVWAS